MPAREEGDWETELTQGDATMAHGAPGQTATLEPLTRYA